MVWQSITVCGVGSRFRRYDKSCLGDVEKALFESDLGMTPSNDGKVIRLNVPQLTTERRKELTKTAKTLGEEGKVGGA